MVAPLEFEKSIIDLELKLNELRHLSGNGEINITDEINRVEKKLEKLLTQTYKQLSPWNKVLVARHEERPKLSHYLEHLIDDFQPLAGDRCYGEDKAIVGGLGNFSGQNVVVLGHEKGFDLETRLKHSFGMPKPEGYRKAHRLFEMANQFNLPILTFVDTPGAHPGVEAEERGQAEAIAKCIESLTNVKVPVIVTITGEGGSGGAIALAVGNSVSMLEHSIYSVITPEGCASILWRNADKKKEAAAAQKFTAQDLHKMKIIDQIIDEPLGGAHRDMKLTMSSVKQSIKDQLNQFLNMDRDALQRHRREKFLNMCQVGL